MQQQHALNQAAREFSVRRFNTTSTKDDPPQPVPGPDWVAVEEPLQVRINGENFSTTMRTPGADRALAIGQLLSEGIIQSRGDISGVSPCYPPPPATGEQGGDVERSVSADLVTVQLAPGVPFEARRNGSLVTNSACGVCGRELIDDLITRIGPVKRNLRIRPAQVQQLMDRLTKTQLGFGRTGGLHAAGAIEPDGTVQAHFEDIGRHNAVDKVLGQLLRQDALPASSCALVVSSRASFEIVQKACVGGFPLLLSVSAPSSLAIETAERAHVTLLGFVRSGGFNAYTNFGALDD